MAQPPFEQCTGGLRLNLGNRSDSAGIYYEDPAVLKSR